MLRVMLDSECDEELRSGVGGVYECSIDGSHVISECSAVDAAIIAAVSAA